MTSRDPKQWQYDALIMTDMKMQDMKFQDIIAQDMKLA